VFLKKMKTLKDYDRIEAQLQRGEKRLEDQKRMEDLVMWKVGRRHNPFATMNIQYPSAQKQYTEDEGQNTRASPCAVTGEAHEMRSCRVCILLRCSDRFLLLTVSRLGYGQWEELRAAISRAWLFRFDWFLKSRTTAELTKRVDYLVKLLAEEKQKEEAKLKEKAKRQGAKTPAKAGKGAAGSAKKKGTPAAKRKSVGGESASKKAKSVGRPSKKAKTKAGQDTSRDADEEDDDGSKSKQASDEDEENMNLMDVVRGRSSFGASSSSAAAADSRH
jgi:SWI/SNF-related matrix-associated actin-dependent regulator of chromatin subfamily A member 5